MSQKMKSILLILFAAFGLALTVRFYPKPEPAGAAKETAQQVETVMETESETIVETSEAAQ